MATSLPTKTETDLIEYVRINGWSATAEPRRDGTRVVTFVRDDEEVLVAFTPNGRVGWARAPHRRLMPTAERVGRYLRDAPRATSKGT